MTAIRATILLATALLSAVLIPAAAAPAAPAQQQQQPICFPGVPGIESCIDPAFAGYWSGNGGLPVFGYPLAPLEQLTPPGAAAPLAGQWTERNRLEQHPGNPAAYRVQIGRVGAERLAQLGRSPGGREAGPQPGCLWFEETGINVCDQGQGQGFRSYWEANGLRIAGLGRYQRSLALFGLPLTSANPEPGPDGELIVTQWFERARFEWHPDNPAQFRVLLGLLGRELRAGQPAAPAPAASAAPLFGVEINRGNVASTIGALPGVGGGLVRYNMVDWSVIEPSKGARDWSKIAGLEAELAAITAAGGTPMVIVSGAPAWAQQQRGKACGPIRADALDEFAGFVGEMVTRYSGPPYNVRYWEFGNEPDAPFQLLPGDAPFGCWGDEQDPLYGGAAYAEMLKAVYPAVKAANPEAQVVTGGLLLDCDPAGPSACAPGRFIEGVLANGGGAAFDLLAYHSYVYWVAADQDWDIGNQKWQHRGGTLAGKAAFLRETMRRFGVDKPLIMNEGALLCYRSDPRCAAEGFIQDQATYAVRLFARSFEAGLYGTLWYTLNGPGWQESGLLDAAQQPRPAYATLAFLRRTFGEAAYLGATRDGQLETHRFRAGGAEYQIAWTNDGSTRDLPLPAGARTIYTGTGEARPVGASLVVGFEPVILELRAP